LTILHLISVLLQLQLKVLAVLRYLRIRILEVTGVLGILLVFFLAGYQVLVLVWVLDLVFLPLVLVLVLVFLVQPQLNHVIHVLDDHLGVSFSKLLVLENPLSRFRRLVDVEFLNPRIQVRFLVHPPAQLLLDDPVPDEILFLELFLGPFGLVRLLLLVAPHAPHAHDFVLDILGNQAFPSRTVHLIQ